MILLWQGGRAQSYCITPELKYRREETGAPYEDTRVRNARAFPPDNRSMRQRLGEAQPLSLDYFVPWQMDNNAKALAWPKLLGPTYYVGFGFVIESRSWKGDGSKELKSCVSSRAATSIVAVFSFMKGLLKWFAFAVTRRAKIRSWLRHGLPIKLAFISANCPVKGIYERYDFH